MKKQLITKILSITMLWCMLIVSSSFKNTVTNTTLITTSKYCEGWEEGYCEGWKDVKGQLAICPVTPICPIPSVDTNHYKGGYNAGFKAGFSAAKR